MFIISPSSPRPYLFSLLFRLLQVLNLGEYVFAEGWRAACNSHDVCYGGMGGTAPGHPPSGGAYDCHVTKAGCDSAFYFDLANACMNSIVSERNIALLLLKGIKLSTQLLFCLDGASIYYGAVAGFAGDAFDSGFDKNCPCSSSTPSASPSSEPSPTFTETASPSRTPTPTRTPPPPKRPPPKPCPPGKKCGSGTG